MNLPFNIVNQLYIELQNQFIEENGNPEDSKKNKFTGSNFDPKSYIKDIQQKAPAFPKLNNLKF